MKWDDWNSWKDEIRENEKYEKFFASVKIYE